MNHLDEGTIHSWLDGAVDATQAREIEAHVAECASCAAAVAEARGLIAGSKRILSALDDVPSVAPTTRGGVVARFAPRRRWSARSWATGLAAALVLAIGITTWNRKGAEQATTPKSGLQPQLPKAAEIATPLASAPAPASTPSPVVVAQRPPASNSVRRADTVVSRQRSALDQAALTRSAPSRGGVAGAIAGNAVASAAAPQQARIPLRPIGGDTSLRTERALAKSVADAEAREADAKTRKLDTAELLEVAGCYPLPRRSDIGRAAASVGKVAGAAADVASRRARMSAPAAAPAASSEFSGPSRTRMFYLDTAQHALGYTVRAEPSDSIVGWWTRLGADSVKVDLLAAGVHAYGRQERIPCSGTRR